MPLVLHATLTQDMVNKLVVMTAEAYSCSAVVAASFLAARWEEFALEAKHAGYATWKMWDEMGLMALVAREALA